MYYKLVNVLQLEMLEMVGSEVPTVSLSCVVFSSSSPQWSCLLAVLLTSEKNDVGSLSEARALLGLLVHPCAPHFLFPPSLSIYFKMLLVQPKEREPVIRPIEHHGTGA